MPFAKAHAHRPGHTGLPRHRSLTVVAAEQEARTEAPPVRHEVQAFGLMHIGSAAVALAVSDLREVIPCPPQLLPLPVPTPGLSGAVRLRGAIIPVMNLRSHLGIAEDDEAREQVIVLMQHQSHLLGLLVSGVSGVAQVKQEQMQALRVSQPLGPGIATHAFEVGDDVVSVLDAARIASLPGVPMVRESSEAIDRRQTGTTEPILLFRCGQISLAVAAMCVEATVPRTQLRGSPLVGHLCRGVIDHHGHEVPVIDTLVFTGLGPRQDIRETSVLVLKLPGGLLGLALDEVCDIVHVGAQDIPALPSFGLPNSQLFRGMVGLERETRHLLLDATAIQTDELLCGLSAMSRPIKNSIQAVAQTLHAAGRAVGSYLTYRIEVETASPLSQASEILPYPESVLPLDSSHVNAALGLFVHRGRVVPLICLGSLLGRSIALDKASARVLVVEDNGRSVGLVVQALCSIENAGWEQPLSQSGAQSHQGMQPLVEVSQGERRRTLPRLDLLQVVRGLPERASAPLALGYMNADADQSAVLLGK